MARPQPVIERIAQAMGETLREARSDPRVSADTLAAMAQQWELGLHMRRPGFHPGYPMRSS
ncbi:hypothetical protein [Piscinibacter sp.]|uniref:hypothetical protein n=1 Tax=Piscinibacter sp. TaxID=1903157 RepID=UPI002ED4162F